MFSSTEFIAFQSDLKELIRSTPLPESVAISNALPHVADALSSIGQQQLTLLREIQSVKNSAPTKEEMKNHFLGLNNRMATLHHGIAAAHTNAATIFCSDSPPTITDHNFTDHNQSPGVQPRLQSGPNTEPSPLPTTAMPLVLMNRSITKVLDAWREYDVGIPPNQPLRILEETMGSAWRKVAAESKYFRRRKPLYDVIIRLKDTIPLDEVLSRLETLNGRCTSLKQLSDKLKASTASEPSLSGEELLQHLEGKI